MNSFAYDDENELIAVWKAGSWSNSFAYDGLMRKRIEKDYSWNGSSWLETNEVHFVYDGNLVVQERNANNLPQVTYTRGNDLSHTLQGAGGIGGLLARTDNGKLIGGSPWATAYYFSDAQGNVVEMTRQLAPATFCGFAACCECQSKSNVLEPAIALPRASNSALALVENFVIR